MRTEADVEQTRVAAWESRRLAFCRILGGGERLNVSRIRQRPLKTSAAQTRAPAVVVTPAAHEECVEEFEEGLRVRC